MKTLLSTLAMALGLWALTAPWGDLALAPRTPAQILMLHGHLPRLAVALLAGACLGLAGALMQAVLRNPLADPTTLGATAGAQLAMVLAIVAAPGLFAFGALPVTLTGAGLAMALVMALGARRGFAPVPLTIAGMLVGMLCAALSSALVLARGEYLLSLVIWNGGALVQDNWSGALLLGATLVLSLLAALGLARPLRVLALGDQALGLRAAPWRGAALAVSVGLTAVVAAEVGLVAFVGLAAPTLARGLGLKGFGAPALAGAVVLALADALMLALQAAGGPSLPTGALTGLIGGPLLLWLLPRLGHQTPAESAPPEAHRATRPGLILTGLALAILLAAGLTLMAGRGPEGWQWVPPALWPAFLPLRAATILAALSAGALLAGAGAILQRLTANPMAAPEVLGVTGGAALGHAVALFIPGAPLALCSAAGGALALLALGLFSRLAPLRLLLGGLAVGAFASGVLGAIMASDDPRAWALMAWMAGSASGVTLAWALTLAGLALALLVGLVLAERWLAILPLGETLAQGLGLRLTLVRGACVATAGIAVGAATVLVGPVSFVGLMAPQIARSLGLGRAAFAPASLGIGALLMVLAAFAARTLAFPYDLPLGLVATLLGAPWVLVSLLRKA